MKVLIGCSSPPDRGSGILTYSKEIASQLRRRDCDVHFASPSPRGSSWLTQQGVRHVATNLNDHPINAAARLLEHVVDHRIDAVINNDNALVQSIAPGIRCPFISVGHLARTSIAALACFQHEWSDYVVSISPDMQQMFTSKYRVPMEKCPVIYNGMTDPGHSGEFSQRDSSKLRVMYVGGFNRRLKGADLILKLVDSIKLSWSAMHLDWFGDIPDDIRQYCSRLRHVTIHGRLSHGDLLSAFRRADVLLFPSRIEGCPMALLEAMSLGVVPIASDGEGAMRWIVADRGEGFVCPLSIWPSRAHARLLYLRDHPDVLVEMKRAARRRFLLQFQSSRVVDDLLSLVRHPTVSRVRPARRLIVLRWHRIADTEGSKAPILNRLFFRVGRLQTAGLLENVTAA